MSIKGKTMVITGASSGIGAALTTAAAKQGARVIMLARNRQRLQALQDTLKQSRGSVEYHCVDLADSEATVGCAKTILQNETPDILVNNAGAGKWLSIQETSDEQLKQIMAVPYFASFTLTREFLPGMIRQGHGRIVNVTSVASKLIWPGSAAYTATRWAVNGFNEALKTEVCELGINTTLAMFGKISSDYWRHNPGSEERLPEITKMVPTITPETAANAILRGIQKNKSFVIKPGMLRLVLWMNTAFPKNTAYIMRKTGWQQSSMNRQFANR
jgi:short-subunit dehydrogenase